ncbi:TetR-like C-terminal domain-containing protein [Arthrobacter sp. AL08]|uniref:TetR/AcrR family transcriptional regulator n=1 Tax=Micrococcaceae TaxID=1268 RepID=UPI00249BC8CD|nr:MULTISPECIES: TetR-like C-terminal domain-containing protein [Micrococcaceae]MDI3241375.1 TetR-like C-terminal domain-containing protein [Arthrobacter sp. AL05]MDI3277368.1 TetR-like C-terminal domain-containing protein [Arthrobacter sp. AL08]MDJ0354031.1 TetR-like C-terminal domain-containing protein [Pseudarthrobacter sp. PH31-O2]
MRRGVTKAGLALAGAELADQIGLQGVTVAALARHFDVKPASLYSHVLSTADLKTGVALLALEELADRASDAIAGRAGKDALMALADSFRDYARDHPGRFAATELRLDQESAKKSAGWRHARFLGAIMREYRLTEINQVHAVRLFGSTIRGFIALEMSGSFDHSAPDAEESWYRILETLDATFSHWPGQ